MLKEIDREKKVSTTPKKKLSLFLLKFGGSTLLLVSVIIVSFPFVASEFYFNRGVDKSNLGKKEEAILDYNKAIELNPSNDNAYSNRGNAKDDLGRKKEAILDYNKAIELNPNNDNAYSNRGIAKNNLDKRSRA